MSSSTDLEDKYDMGSRVSTLWVWIPVLLFISQVILGKLPNLSELFFQMLYGVDDYFIGLWWCMNELIHASI